MESVTNPPGAHTCAKGTFYVAYQNALAELSAPAAIGCTQTGTNVTAATIGLTATFNTNSCTSPDDVATGSIAHVASTDGNCFSVTLALGGGCNCKITSVYAHVHNRSGNTCPQTANNYCWAAGANFPTSNTVPFRVVGGALNSTSVTVQPNWTNVGGTVCTGDAGIHWGSPNATAGRLVVNVTCT